MKESLMAMKTDKIVFRTDLYPRIDHDPALVQRYAADLDVLPPIEVNQHYELIDGWHRWTAHKKNGAETIKALVTHTANESEFLALAIKRNASHGKQLTDGDKKKMAIRLYNGGEGLDKPAIAETLSVSLRMVTSYLTDIDRQMQEERKEKIFAMWLACHTQEEIAAAVGLDKATANRIIEVCCKTEELPKSNKLAVSYADFEPPIYNVWTFNKKSNEVGHFGNSEQRIVDNLLYLFTNPFDIVVDPFGGGGSTIDVCKKRMRRYWVSDRKPIVERENEIRNLDICEEMPSLTGRWGDVSLVYLDPPYWRQAKDKYSQDETDLANMDLDQFTEKLVGVVRGFAAKMKRGHIALLIQPTQWVNDNREVADHVIDVIFGAAKDKRLKLKQRISCPYQTEQYLPQQVEWAKENKACLVITRELIVWSVTNGK